MGRRHEAVKRLRFVVVMAILSIAGCNKGPSSPGPVCGNILPPTTPPVNLAFASPRPAWIGSLTGPLEYPEGCITALPTRIWPGSGSTINLSEVQRVEITIRVALCAGAPEYSGPLYDARNLGVTISTRVTNSAGDLLLLPPNQSHFQSFSNLRLAPGEARDYEVRWFMEQSSPSHYQVIFNKGDSQSPIRRDAPIGNNGPPDPVRFHFPLGWEFCQ